MAIIGIVLSILLSAVFVLSLVFIVAIAVLGIWLEWRFKKSRTDEV